MGLKKTSAVGHWLKVCNGLSRANIKTAEIGGNDVSFEQAFSNLAHAQLKESAPSLLDYEVGFQLVDSNEDHTKAIGIFAFKVGSQWLYAPIFYLNGKLKGNELLYLKNQDMFVPLSEKWLNYLLNRKPDILGDGVTRNSSQLGVSYPDLRSLQRSPSKMAAAGSLREMIAAVMPMIGATTMLDVPATMRKIAADFHLPTFLGESLDNVEQFIKLCYDMPDLAVWFESTHGLQTARDAMKTAAAKPRRAVSVMSTKFRGKCAMVTTGSLLAEPERNPVKTGSLRIYTHGPLSRTAPADLTADERSQLLCDKVLVKDAREEEEVSIAYNVQVSQRLQNPTETGLYEVLVKPHEFERCLVVLHPHGANGRAHFATLIPTSGDKWLNVPATQIWVGEQLTRDDYKEWFDGLSKSESLAQGAKYVVIGPTGDATLPFSPRYEHGSIESEGNTYEVEFEDHCSYPQYTGMPRNRDYPEVGSYNQYRDGARIHLDGKMGSKLRVVRGDVYVPEDFKVIKLAKSWKEKHEDACCVDGPFVGSSDPSPLRPGDILDSHMMLMRPKTKPAGEAKEPTEDEKKYASFTLATAKEANAYYLSKTASLAIVADGPDITINGNRMGPVDAVVHLVRDHCLREKEAREMLKRARLRHKFACRLRYPDYVKSANPNSLLGNSYAPPMPEPQMSGNSMFGGQIPEQQSMQESVPVPGLSGRNTDPNVYNPAAPIQGGLQPQEMQAIQQSLQSGQREVIDTTVISNMLKTVNDDTMIDKYMGALLRGLDGLCRILFFFYWHGEEFADRYGKQDLPELEDALRNTVESMGDVCIFLRQKSVDPYPGGGDLDLNLDTPASA